MEVEYYTIAEFQSCISDGISFHGGQKAEVSLGKETQMNNGLLGHLNKKNCVALLFLSFS